MMPKGDVDIMVADEFMYNPDGVSSVCEIDCVMLLEALNKGELEDVFKVLQFAEEYGKPVIGFITV